MVIKNKIHANYLSFIRHFLKKENTLLLLLLLFFIATRLFHLTIIPIFNDESIHIYWAKLIATSNKQWFISLIDGEPPLFIWMTVLFLKLLPSSWYLVAGRIPSVIAGAIGLIGTYYLTKQLFSSTKTALIAGVLFTSCPFIFFFDRLASYDALLSAFGIWTICFAVKTSKTLSRGDAVWWGIFLGLTLLSKASGVIFIPLSIGSFFVMFSFPLSKYPWKKILLVLLTSVVVAALMNAFLLFSHGYHLYSSTGISRYTLPVSTLLKNPFIVFPSNIVFIFSNFLLYLTWPLFFLGIAGFFFILLREKKKGVLLFFLWGFPILGIAFTGAGLSARHFLFTVPYFLIIISYIFSRLITLNKRFGIFIIFYTLIFPIYFISMLLIDPPHAPMPLTDAEQYIEGYASGYGLEKIFTFLSEKAKTEPISVITLGSISDYPYAFNLEFWNNPHVTVIAIWPVENDSQKKIAELTKMAHVYVVLKVNTDQGHTNFLKELSLQEILRSYKPNGSKPIILAIPKT